MDTPVLGAFGGGFHGTRVEWAFSTPTTVRVPGPAWIKPNATTVEMVEAHGSLDSLGVVNSFSFVATPRANFINIIVADERWSATNLAAPCPEDVSDAPAAYAVANHAHIAGDPVLGATLTFEPSASPSFTATGDSDDGVLFGSPYVIGEDFVIPQSDITAPNSGTIHAWIDFNQNNLFEASEYQLSTVSGEA